jgi:hypothetical protein
MNLYEYQGKKEEIHKLKYIVFDTYILSIRFHKILFVCEYQLCEQIWNLLDRFTKQKILQHISQIVDNWFYNIFCL